MSTRKKKATCVSAITMAAASTARARIGHPSKRRRSNATPQRGPNASEPRQNSLDTNPDASRRPVSPTRNAGRSSAHALRNVPQLSGNARKNVHEPKPTAKRNAHEPKPSARVPKARRRHRDARVVRRPCCRSLQTRLPRSRPRSRRQGHQDQAPDRRVTPRA